MRPLTILAVIFSVYGFSVTAQTERFTSQVQSAFSDMVSACITVMEKKPSKEGLEKLGFSRSIDGYVKRYKFKPKGSIFSGKVDALTRPGRKSHECLYRLFKSTKVSTRTFLMRSPRRSKKWDTALQRRRAMVVENRTQSKRVQF